MRNIAGAVTFDFHNTLVQCDQWFDLEVRHITSDYLRWQGELVGSVWSHDTLLAADATYRDLRVEIMEHGRELSAADGVREAARRLHLDIDDTAVDRGIEELMHGALTTIGPMPGAEDTVAYLHGAGVKMGIVSSAVYHPFLDWSLKRLAMDRFFEAIMTSASTGFYKSRPEIFQHAAGKLGVTTEEVSHVGDSFRFDVLGARRAGMRTVWVRHPGQEPLTGEPPADLTLSTLVGAGPVILQHLNWQTPEHVSPDE
jgi:FMN phosphatase YigB (HAD superfamily)